MIHLSRRELMRKSKSQLVEELISRQKTLATADLHAVIEAMSEGFILIDENEKMVACNSAYRNFYPGLADVIKPGVTIRKIITAAADRQTVDRHGQSKREWVQQRLKKFRAAEGVDTQKLEDGRYIRTTERRTASGGVVSLRADITDAVEGELALQESERHSKRLIDAFDALDESVAVVDADDKFVFCNRQYLEHNKHTPEHLSPGGSYRDHLKALLAKGMIAEAVGREDAWLIERLQRHSNPEGAFAQYHRSGTWFLLQERRLMDGGAIMLASDITDLKRTEEALRESQQRLADHNALLQMMLDAVPIGITIKDTGGRLEYVNRQLRETWNLSITQTTGMRAGDIAYPEYGARLEALDKRVLETGESVREDEMPVDVEGRTLYRTVSKVPVRDRTGKILHIVTSFTDITDRLRMETELRDSRQQLAGQNALLHTMLDAVPMGITIKNADGRLEYMNRLVRELWGLSAAEAPGLRFSEINAEYGKQLEALDKQVLQSGRAVSEVELVANVQGHAQRRLVSKVPVRDNSDNIVHIVSSFVDITERVRMEEALRRNQVELARQRDELASLNAEKNRFFSIIAHDLKSPFTALLGLTQLMATASDKFSRHMLIEFAKSVNEAGEQVFDLLQNLLEWSRLQMEGATFEPKPVRLRDLAQECIDVLKTVSLEKNIAVKNNIRNTEAFADPDMVLMVIRNLISNALKFTPIGGAITISSRRKGKWVHFTVADNGVGMSAAQTESVFALDDRSSTPGTAGERGTGLGLTLCQDLLARNGGSIWIDSKVGDGSRIHFSLPAQAETD